MIAWQALAAAGGYLTATSLQGLIINSQSDYDPTRWQGTLLVFAVIFFCFLFNTWLAKYLPQTEQVILLLHICLFVAVLVSLTVLAPQKAPLRTFGRYSPTKEGTIRACHSS